MQEHDRLAIKESENNHLALMNKNFNSAVFAIAFLGACSLVVAPNSSKADVVDYVYTPRGPIVWSVVFDVADVVDYDYTPKGLIGWSGVFDVKSLSSPANDSSNYNSVSELGGGKLAPLDINTFSLPSAVVWDQPGSSDTFFQVFSDSLYKDIFISRKTWNDLIAVGTYDVAELLVPEVGYCGGAAACFRQQPNFINLLGSGGTIKFTPGPLPALGAAFAFSFSRKLRNRIRESKP